MKIFILVSILNPLAVPLNLSERNHDYIVQCMSVNSLISLIFHNIPEYGLKTRGLFKRP